MVELLVRDEYNEKVTCKCWKVKNDCNENSICHEFGSIKQRN